MKSTRSQSAPKKAARRGPKSDYVIEVWKGGGEQPFFARLASSHNGQPIATSEGYSTKQKRTKTWAPIAERLKCEIVEVAAPAASTTEQTPSAAPTPAPVPAGAEG